MKKSWVIILAMMPVICLLVGCSGPAEKEFTKDGFTITLTENFKEEDAGGSFLKYKSDKDLINVFVEKSDNMEALTERGVSGEKEYAQMWLTILNKDEEIIEADGLTYYRYVDGLIEKMHVAVKSPGAFYLVQFQTPADDFSKWFDQFKTWANSIKA